MRSTRHYFQNDRGLKLSASLDMPLDGRIDSYAIFAHCFTCGKNLKISHYISRSLTRHHIAVLRFDFTGLGESEGDFSQTNFSTNIDDLISAAGFLAAKYKAPQLLIGHSLGGTAALAAVKSIPSCRAVTIIGSPFEPIHIMDHFPEEKAIIKAQGKVNITVGGQTFMLTKQFLDDLSKKDMQQAIRNLDLPLLIIHSPQDLTVDIDNAARVYQAARHPKSFISLDNADHLLSRETDASYAGSMIATWAHKYLQIAGQQPPGMHEDGYVITNTSRDGFYTEIQAGGHSMIADEPRSAGGTDHGPSPYEFISAALGSCTGMTLRMYADHKGWNLEEVNIRLRHAKIHADDCSNCADGHTMIDTITRDIELIGNLTEDQKTRLVEIANRCPVHRTLQQQVIVTTRLSN
jgi:uncharacterized OsmC-like protein/alpha-beta hydrolase superfamily lysophospholipase